MTLSDAAASVSADAVLGLLDRGFLRLYDSTGALLIECRFAGPAFDSADAGRARVRPVTSARAVGQGRAKTFWAYRADGRGVVLSGTVGTESEAAIAQAQGIAQPDLVLDDTEIQLGASVEIMRLTYRQPLTGMEEAAV